ncbi:glycoside hydrolase family 25 protein [Aureimonas sp. ME7]|uniref:glycoside hydrolase family 25 protein n=1 Tax=Aureimonas sp. ME7 TaxID=2744252 RepID=UPI001FCEDF82|nr:glycoside hydrolase family 25 protein [Aureimonas sp. ME7]
MAAGAVMAGAVPAKAEWDRPWRNEDLALVIDAYEFNPINWKELTSNKRIAAFINKASDGLAPSWTCRGLSGDEEKLCKNRWWKYSVTQELYMTRREMAKTLGLKWGAYHLGRPGNPREQADHFVDFAKPEPDELIALDIEDNDPTQWMSLAEAEEFARQIKIRLDRYPVLYTNGSTAAYIAQNRETYPLLSRMQLWYARYRDDLTGVFPEGHWDKYALWQFSSMHNCNKRSCPYRVPGAKDDIDVNVAAVDVEGLRKAWPFNGLVEPETVPDAGALIAEVGAKTKDAVAEAATEVASLVKPKEAEAGEVEPTVPGTLAAAYGPATHAPVDPLKLLTETALQEQRAKATHPPVLSALTQGAKTEPTPPADRHPVPGSFAAQVIATIGQLREEMKAVRAILNDVDALPGEALATTPQSPAKAEVLRSRILEMMKAAEAAVQDAPAEKPVGSPSAEERAELQKPRGGWTLLSSYTPGERRVARAFHATR